MKPTRAFILGLSFSLLAVLSSCGRDSEYSLSEDQSLSNSVSQSDIENVSTDEILNLIRTTGNTYNSENFKTMRYCANCLAQRGISEVATGLVESQLNFLKGVFVDGAYGDFRMVVYDAPSLLQKTAIGLYQLDQKMRRFVKSYGSMVSEYYTGQDHLGYGSEYSRNQIDKTVHTMMSMKKFLEEKGYPAAESLVKYLYKLYKNPNLLKERIYDMVRLFSTGLSIGHGFARSTPCESIVALFQEWIPRLQGMIAYEVLIEVVLGVVTVGTGGAAAVAVGAKLGVALVKIGKLISKVPNLSKYFNKIIEGLKHMAEVVIRVVKRGEDFGPVAKQSDELRHGDELSQIGNLRSRQDLDLPPICRIGLGLTSGSKCLADELNEKISHLVPHDRVPIILEYMKAIVERLGLKKNSRLTTKNKRTVYSRGSGKKTTYYSVDTQHGHLEVCNRKGKHQGSIDIDGREVPGKQDLSGGHDIVVD